jgi:tetratricopeptide (TPR) repeat protein
MDAVDSDLENPDLENPDLENQRNYQKLMVALESSEGTLNLLICVCDDRTYREQLIHDYEAELQQQNVHPYRLRLAWQQPSLRRSLLQLTQAEPNLQQGTPAVITVMGMDELLSVKLDAEKSEQEQLFFSLQWTREALREFRYPIVLWLSNAVLVRLADRAPDFWSWRGGVFWFASPLQARIDAQIERARTLATEKGLLDPHTAAAWDAVEELQAESADRRTRPEPPSSLPERSLPDDPTGLPVEDLKQLIAQIEQQQGSDAPLLATLYDSLGRAYARRLDRGEADDYPQERQRAIDAFETAIALQTRLGLESDLINSLFFVANLYRFRHEFDTAAAYYERAFHLAKKLGNRWAEGAVLNNLGLAYESLGRYQQAIEFYQKALTIFQELGNRQGEASSLGNLGIAYRNLGQYIWAIEFLQQCLGIKRELGEQQGEAIALGNLGIAYGALGQDDRATEFFQQRLKLTRELGERQGEASSLSNLGVIYKNLGQYERAIQFQQQSLNIERELGNRQGEARSLGNLGNTYDSLGHHDRAIKFYQQSLELTRDLGDRQGEANALGNLGNTYDSLGHHDRAIEFYQQSLELTRDLGDQHGEAIVLFNLGMTQKKLGQTTAAVENFHHARELFQAMGLEALVQKCDTEIQRLEGETV